MDFTLKIIISKLELEKLEVHEQFVEWGGEFFSQDPPKYFHESGLIFEMLPMQNIFLPFIDESIEVENGIVIVISLNDLFDIYKYHFNNMTDVKNNRLFIFITKIIELNKYYLLLNHDDEGIKRRYATTKPVDLIEILLEIFRFPDKGGALITRSLQEISN